MKTLVLASNNKNKLREFRELFSGTGIEVISQSEAGCSFEVEETGTTFAENAWLKANAVTAASGLPAVADDSGLIVDALNGEPGIYSARYGPGHSASDSDRYNYLLNKLGDEKDRTARFVCSICCTFPNGDTIRTEETLEGSILYKPSGSNGFGYDPIFSPDGYDCSNADLSKEEKNAISHRGKAVRKFLTEYLRYCNDNK